MKQEFIKFLEGAGVLKFGDFTAKSGRKIPYFINAGDIKTGEQICKLGEFYAKAYFEKLGKKPTVLYGPAYKGISIAVSAANNLALAASLSSRATTRIEPTALCLASFTSRILNLTVVLSNSLRS